MPMARNKEVMARKRIKVKNICIIFDLEVEGQGHIEVMNVRDTLSQGNIARCQIRYVFVEEQRSNGPDMYSCEQKDIILTLMSRVKDI